VLSGQQAEAVVKVLGKVPEGKVYIETDALGRVVRAEPVDIANGQGYYTAREGNTGRVYEPREVQGKASFTDVTGQAIRELPGQRTQAAEPVAPVARGTVAEGAGEIGGLLKQSTCSSNDFYKYLRRISGDYADAYAKMGEWPSDVQIPKSPDVLKPDGSINWAKAPKGGYVLDSNGDAVKSPYVPGMGEVIDRSGPPNGRFASPVRKGKPYSYTKRSLPYVENPSQYHRYKVIGDFSKLEQYVRDCSDIQLRNDIYEYVDIYYGGAFSKMIVYHGEIAKIKGWGTGGGIQYELPLKIEWLKALRVLEEIHIGQ
jgi:hypothetical protein